MHTGDREIGNINFRKLASFFGHDVDPPMAMPWLGDGIRQKVIADKLILTGEKTVVAFLAFCDVDD
jgi:hypothetical protein